jgi:PilZ domain
MALSLRASKNFSIPRREPRMPMEIGVHIAGHAAIPGTETTFTENVSQSGVRVLSSRRWKTNDRLTITTPGGSFHSIARVAYCHPVSDARFAIGLELIEPSGVWVLGGQTN